MLAKTIFQALNMISFVVCCSFGTDEIVLNTFGQDVLFYWHCTTFFRQKFSCSKSGSLFSLPKNVLARKNHLTSLGWRVFLKVFDTMKLCSEVGSWKKLFYIQDLSNVSVSEGGTFESQVYFSGYLLAFQFSKQIVF